MNPDKAKRLREMAGMTIEDAAGRLGSMPGFKGMTSKVAMHVLRRYEQSESWLQVYPEGLVESMYRLYGSSIAIFQVEKHTLDGTRWRTWPNPSRCVEVTLIGPVWADGDECAPHVLYSDEVTMCCAPIEKFLWRFDMIGGES